MGLVQARLHKEAFAREGDAFWVDAEAVLCGRQKSHVHQMECFTIYCTPRIGNYRTCCIPSRTYFINHGTGYFPLRKFTQGVHNLADQNQVLTYSSLQHTTSLSLESNIYVLLAMKTVQ